MKKMNKWTLSKMLYAMLLVSFSTVSIRSLAEVRGGEGLEGGSLAYCMPELLERELWSCMKEEGNKLFFYK